MVYVKSGNYRPQITTYQRYGAKKPATVILRSDSRQAMASAYRKSKVYPGFTQRVGAYKRSMWGESKYIDNTFSVAGVPTTIANTAMTNIDPGAPAAGASFCLIPQGTTKNSRIGNKCRVYGCRIHATMIVPTNTTAGGDIVRIIVYRDKQANGAANPVTAILEDTTDLDSFRAMDYVDKTQILYDKYHVLNNNYGISGTNAGPAYKHIVINIKANQEIRYSSTTGAITEIQSDNYAMAMVGAEGIAVVSGIVRTYFKDH